MKPARAVQVVVPEGIGDPLRPSGGNTYDRRLLQTLEELGWSVSTCAVPGPWPWAGAMGYRALADALGAMPDGAVVLVDGLVASAAPAVLVPATQRLRVVVLLHMPLGLRTGEARSHESSVVSSADAVIVTSEWSRGWVLASYGVEPGRVHVARPGTDAAAVTIGSPEGGRMLCVGPVTPEKGHDVLVAALAQLAGLDWRCVCVGTLDSAPDFVTDLRRRIGHAGLDRRILLVGPRTGRKLDETYAASDMLVHPSLVETFGMVVTEALARSIPVLAAHVGGVPEALGVTDHGMMPGLLTPPADVDGLAGVLELWLCDADLRDSLRDAARRRRSGLVGWYDTAERVAGVLLEVAS